MHRAPRYSQDNCNEAPLKVISTAKRMTRQQHASLVKEKIERRRELEMAKELKQINQDYPW